MSAEKKSIFDSNSGDKSERIQELIRKSQQLISKVESEQDSPNIDERSLPQQRYEIQGLIGSGSMGEVYRAYDVQLQRVVALKFLRKGEPELSSQFLREARLQARVEHNHVCSV
ncbi:hypothetical protein L0152_23780, partial [bacterium]|nr:hypothetical protein [bacterium]